MDEGERPVQASGDTAGAGTDGLDRRELLSWSWKALAAALVVEAGWTSYDLLNPSASGAFGGIVDAGPVADYAQEGTVSYFLDGRFYVTQFRGGLRALYQKCPHLGCRVPFCESSERFECPCHGSVYNIIGEYLAGPAPRGMDRFPIHIRDGHVLVDTSTVVPGPDRGVLTGLSAPAGPSCLGETSAAIAIGTGAGATPDTATGMSPEAMS
jgi:cytochrome b6-f complex iron-sulfur subunit